MKFLRGLIRFLPTLLFALVLSIVVWVSAVTSNDPNEETLYPTPIPLTILGLDHDLVIVNDIPESLTITILAPRSIQNRLLNDPDLIQATLNLSGLSAGVQQVNPQVNLDVRPARVKLFSPSSITVELEELITKKFDVQLNQVGSLPISYEAGDPQLTPSNVSVMGPRSQVEMVAQVIASVGLTNVTSDINVIIKLQALNAGGQEVKNVSMTPGSIKVEIPVRQLGGYRNVFVKIVTSGQIASGFYLTNIFAFPPNVTIYTSDPELAANLPAFVETNPVNINGADEDMEINIPLNLPDGIIIVGEPTIRVEIGIAAIESSKNFLNVKIQPINLNPDFSAQLSASSVDIYLSGPLYLLDELSLVDIVVTVDLADLGPGTHQVIPQVTLLNEAVTVDSILPGTIEVIISQK